VILQTSLVVVTITLFASDQNAKMQMGAWQSGQRANKLRPKLSFEFVYLLRASLGDLVCTSDGSFYSDILNFDYGVTNANGIVRMV
jgi:hypothetical protein